MNKLDIECSVTFKVQKLCFEKTFDWRSKRRSQNMLSGFLQNNWEIFCKNTERCSVKILRGALNSTRPIFRARPIGHAKKGVSNNSQCVHLAEKQQETIILVLCCLNTACSFHFYCNSIKNFCSKTFAVWILFECLRSDASQRIMLILIILPQKLW